MGPGRHGDFDLRGYLESVTRLRRVTTSQRDGHREFTLCCPSCGKPDKVMVSERSGRWTCYSEGIGGAFPQLMALLEEIPEREAWQRWNAGRVHALGPIRPTIVEEFVPEPVRLPEEFEPVWDAQHSLWNVPDYLTDRGISKETAREHGVGFCRTGPYAHRLVFPGMHLAQLVGFQARAMRKFLEPKMLNPNFPKTRYLIGHDLAVLSEQVLVVEGPIDVLRLSQKGLVAVGMMGKKLSTAQVHLLLLGGFDSIVLLPDADDPGAWPAALYNFDLFGGHEVDVRIAWLDEGRDPGDATRSQVSAALKGARPPTAHDRREIRRGRIPLPQAA